MEGCAEFWNIEWNVLLMAAPLVRDCVTRGPRRSTLDFALSPPIFCPEHGILRFETSDGLTETERSRAQRRGPAPRRRSAVAPP